MLKEQQILAKKKENELEAKVISLMKKIEKENEKEALDDNNMSKFK